jgi:hypothetical protein
MPKAAYKLVSKLLKTKKKKDTDGKDKDRGIKTNIGGPTGSYFGTKTTKQKLDIAGNWRKKGKNRGKPEDK